MSVTEIGALHGRYTRLVDRFKSAWTYHQVAGGAFRSLLFAPLPYQYDFQRLYDDVKAANPVHTSGGEPATGAIERCERELDAVSRLLLSADEAVTPPLLRRFFEKLKKQDEGLLHQLIKFYFYARAVDGDRRDKIDFLL
ncbi:MAG TPA: hypothetical protein VFL80_09085, partial [Thermoanaerobaculia bacterium]|nr:hypothetical protein [Thermoanaerobaculia bacterium]